MAFDFPTNPSIGNTYTIAGITYIWDGVAWNVSMAPPVQATAQTRNRVVNPAMSVSQENGITTGTAVGYYVADQWLLNHISSSTITGGRAVGSGITPFYIGVAASPAETAAAAGEYVSPYTVIEGLNLVEFALGSPSSQPFVIAFHVAASVVGTYWVAVVNKASTHSWLGSYTISASEVGQWVRKTIAVPAGAINAGAWPIDNTGCVALYFTFHCGSTYTGVAGFQAALKVAGPGQALGLSTAAGCYITNVGLYLDPDATGLPPPFQVPAYDDDLRACRRYYERPISGYRIYASPSGYTGCHVPYMATKRVIPTNAFVSNGGITSASTFQSFYGTYDTGVDVQFGPNVSADGYNYGFTITANARM